MQGNISAQAAAENIQRAAGSTALSIHAFFKALTIYYQCDVGAYTKDAGGLPFLEKVFAYKDGGKVVNLGEKILRFSPNFEVNYKQLEILLT